MFVCWSLWPSSIILNLLGFVVFFQQVGTAASENVIILVTLIEQAGDNIPRIKASTLIERNVQLAERLEAAKNPRTLLKTTFTKTWELLRTKTRLTEFYKNIKLPDPGDPAFMPTMRTLDSVVFTFEHEGKKQPK